MISAEGQLRFVVAAVGPPRVTKADSVAVAWRWMRTLSELR
jgi:hypothetical protein